MRPPPFSPALVIFDCDGTLVDSEHPNNKALCEVLAEHGFGQYDIDYAMQHFVGKTISDILLTIRMKHGYVFPEGTSRRVIERSNQLYLTDLRPVHGADALLARVGACVPICVASNGERQSVLTSLRLCNILGTHVSERCVFTKNQVSRGKPAPDLFLFAAEKMGAEPASCVVVEDSEAGVMAGRAAGMYVVGFTGTATHAGEQARRLGAAGADETTDSLIHISEVLVS